MLREVAGEAGHKAGGQAAAAVGAGCRRGRSRRRGLKSMQTRWIRAQDARRGTNLSAGTQARGRGRKQEEAGEGRRLTLPRLQQAQEGGF